MHGYKTQQQRGGSGLEQRGGGGGASSSSSVSSAEYMEAGVLAERKYGKMYDDTVNPFREFQVCASRRRSVQVSARELKLLWVQIS